MKNRPTIILAAHGSRETPALHTFRRFDSAVRAAFPNHSVIWTFADYIQQKLKAENTDCWCARVHTADSLAKLHLSSAIVQPLFITPVPLAPACASLEFTTGSALLNGPKSIDELAAILTPQCTDPQTAYILCGHGSKKKPERNRPLIELHKKIRTGRNNVFLATLDGPPGNQAPLEAVRSAGFKKARFIPLLFAAGMHVQSDIMGDQPTSWKSKLGLPCTLSGPLGEHPQVIHLLINRISNLLSSCQ